MIVKQAAKSKMIWLAGILSFLGPLLEAFPEAKEILAEHYGWAFVVLSGIVGILRFMTTNAIQDK